MILICISADGSDTLIFLRSQDAGTIFPNFRSLMAGYLSVIGIQLKQYLVGTLMCQRKPAFSAEFPNILRFNEALIQNHIIGFQKDAPLTSVYFYLIFCIHIRGQTICLLYTSPSPRD